MPHSQRYGPRPSRWTIPADSSVASSRDSRELLDAVQVTAPGSIAGVKPGQYSVALNYDGVDVTKPVVKMTDATNLDGCATFSAADKAKVTGKFVWLEWDDNDATRRCGSAGRSARATALERRRSRSNRSMALDHDRQG